MTRQERLWEKLKDFFEDQPGSYHAGGSVGFDALAPEEVECLWKHIETRATSIDDPSGWAPYEDDAPSPEMPEAVRRVVDGGLDYLSMRVRGIRSAGCVLSDVWVEVVRDGLSLYWWVGHPEDDWNSTTASALVDLLVEMWEMVPLAVLECEHHEDDPLVFWGAVDEYRRIEDRS